MAELVQDISEESWLKFGAGKLSELCKLLPEESEVNPFLYFFSLTPNSFMLDFFPPALYCRKALKCVAAQVKQLLSFSGNLSTLPEADQFMVQLVKVAG